jgi:dTDP-4-dehydrorhamnose 3,5-epimerase-like enzyme
MQFIKPYDERSDRRGHFVGLINDHSFEEINTLTTVAGEVRGGHYHKETSELILITQGTAEFLVTGLDGTEIYAGPVEQGTAVLIEPYEVHTVKAITDVAWINALTHRFEPGAPDIHMP